MTHACVGIAPWVGEVTHVGIWKGSCKMTTLSSLSAFIGNLFSYIQDGMDTRLRGNERY